VGRYALDGPIAGAPRRVDYAYAAPSLWRASIGGVTVWLENEMGYYWRSDDVLWLARHDEDSVVFRHPLPELGAIREWRGTIAWLGVQEPWAWTGDEPDRYLDRAVRRLQGDDGSTRLEVTVDCSTSFVLAVLCQREQGVLRIVTEAFAVASSAADTFGHDNAAQAYSGPRVQALE